jgi:hypothetical protein
MQKVPPLIWSAIALRDGQKISAVILELTEAEALRTIKRLYPGCLYSVFEVPTTPITNKVINSRLRVVNPRIVPDFLRHRLLPEESCKN